MRTTGQGVARPRDWLGLAVLSIACLLYSMDLTVLHLAVPAISTDLRPSSTQLLWIIDIYGFLVAGALITVGALGDRIGRRRLLLWGAAAFGVASVAAALSTTPEALIASRALLGVAGATVAPSTLSLIFSMFLDPHQRAFAIGVWIASFSAGGALGPVLGGILLEHFWWGSVFLLALPVMALVLVLGPLVLPEHRDPNAGRLDVVSAALSLAALLALISALKDVAANGPSLRATGYLVAAAIIGAVFVARQRRLTDPMIDPALFRVRRFSASLTAYLLSIFVSFGYVLFVSQYLQLVLGFSPLQAGLLSVPSALGFILGSLLAPRYLRGFRPATVMTVGFAVAAAGLASLLMVDTSDGVPIIVAASFVISLVLAPVISLATELIVGSAPPEKASTASGISETSAELGGALGIAVLGSIGVAAYRADLRADPPAGVPVTDLVRARETLGEALDVAMRLPPEAARALVDAANEAFVRGLHIAAGISAVAALASAALVYSALRSVPRPRPPDLEPPTSVPASGTSAPHGE